MNGVRILIVEDESIVALNLTKRLTEAGYTIAMTATTGEAAIQAAEEMQPDLILMDIRLKGEMDGIEAAEQIRDRYNIPIIYLTAYADQHTLQRAKVTQPYGYILKPFETRELRSAIELALYKHRTEQLLKAREEWLSTTLASIGNGVITTDQLGQITFINPMAAKLTGWELAEAMGQAIEVVFRISYQETGDRVPVLQSIATVDTATVDTATLDTATIDTATIDQSDHASADLSEPADSTLHSLHDAAPYPHPNQHPPVWLTTRHGQQIPIDYTTTPILNAQGGVLGAVVIFQDSSEYHNMELALRRANYDLEQKVAQHSQDLRLSRERLQHLLSSSPTVLYTTLPNDLLKTTFISENVFNLLGYRAEEFVSDRQFWANRIHPDDVQRVFAGLSMLFETGNQVQEYRFLHQDGSYRWMYDQMQLIQDQHGNALEIVGSLVDLTDRKQIEAERQQAADEMQRALAQERDLNALRSRIITTVSHEYRTPLATILSSAELLERYGDQWPPEKRQKHIQRIQTMVGHMTNLVNDMLCLNQMESNTLQFKPMQINLPDLCQEIVDELQLTHLHLYPKLSRHTAPSLPSAPSELMPQHQFEFIQDNCPPYIYADEYLLRQILTNLLSNAIKYSPDGGTIRLMITVPDPCQELMISITDEGLGIPMEDQQRVLEAFQRASNVGNISGTGMGLAIAHKCVKLHGGDISLSSEPGHGTTVTVTLPLQYTAIHDVRVTVHSPKGCANK